MGRLERIEVENFKSYKGHQTIGPFFDFTSVIGPNGAGKSNLMDAISFVLGVRSAQLRSSQLQDLIFRPPGEDDPRPSKASVRLVYLNGEGDEIHFTRRITASGGSDYLLNEKVVTFAQYSKTLQKENILVKARNFLVFQGDVESVAAQSPKDLTKLIEQISGSLELKEQYDALKVDAEKTNADLTDKINKKKVSSNEIRACKMQKEEAEKYNQLIEERADLVIRLLLWTLFHIEQDTEALRKSVKDLEKESAAKEAKLQRSDADLESKKKEHAAITKDNLAIEKRQKKKEQEIEAQRPLLESAKAQVAHSEQKIEVTKKNVDKLQKDIARYNAQIADFEKQLEQVTRSSQQQEERLRSQAKQAGVSLNEAQTNEYKELRAKVEVDAAKERMELQSAQRTHRHESEQRARLSEKLRSLESHRKGLLEKKEEMEKRKEKIQAVLGVKVEKLNQVKEQVEKNTTLRQENSKIVANLQDKFADAEKKLSEAKADRKEGDREKRLADALESMKKLYPGVRGRVFDLCSPTQSRYKIGITVILGKNMDAIVVDDSKTARECVQYMREQRAGVATFIPLDSIRVKPLAERLRRLDKGARLAIDCVKFDSEYQKAMQYAFGESLLCDTLDVAKDICFRRNEKLKAVSLDGTMIHKSGLMTGGSSDIAAKAKRWEERDIEALRRNRENFLKNLQEAERQQKKLQGDMQASGEITVLEDNIRTMKTDLATCDQKLTEFAREIKDGENSIAATNQELAGLDKRLEPLEAQIRALEKKVAAVEDHIFKDFCAKIKVANIREYEQSTLRALQEINEKKLEYDAQRSRLQGQLDSEKRQQEDFKRDQEKSKQVVKEEEGNLGDLRKKEAKLTQQLEKLVEERREIKAEIEAGKKKLLDVATELKAAKEKHEEILQEIGALKKLMTAKDNEIQKDLAERHAIFKKCRMEDIALPLRKGSLHDLTVESSDDMEVDTLDTQQAQELYQAESAIRVDYSSLPDELRKRKGDKKVEEELQEKIKQIGAEIERAAPNMRAGEKLDEVEEKQKAISEELENARKLAKTTKDKFLAKRQERYDLFIEAFTHISGKIDEIYKDLTKSQNYPSGGNAYLNLENSEEPFEEGVTYHAMPPMKKFRDIDQLSGGEQTVAALALLFAINSFRPAPFFVLDEVDSALDNVNVNRVANYIKNIASDTFQVIQISFKSGLYERADALVGIYRDTEEGSSKVLTLKLADYD